MTETAVAERPTESRRRADRVRSVTFVPAPETAPEHQPASETPRMRYGVDSVATTAPAAPAEQPAAELPQPAAAPEPGISAEQLAQREAQMAASQAALENASDTPGLMNAFADAPPTVKAQVSGELGTRMDTTLSQDTTTVQQETPDIQATMQGNTPVPAGNITTAPSEIILEADPAVAPEAETVVGEPVQTEADYQANNAVVSQLTRSFQAEGGADDVGRALDSVQTTDPSIVTSPGSAPPIPLEGETDPQRIQTQIESGSQQAQATLSDQQAQAQTLPGVERVQLADVHESHAIGELPAVTAEDASAPEGAQQYLAMNQPPELQTAFDDVAGASMQQSMAEARTQIEGAAQERDQAHQQEVETAQRETSTAQQQAEAEQRTAVADSRRDIEAQRQTTLEQQQAAVVDLEQQTADRSQTDRAAFDDRVQADQQQLDQRYRQAETDAEGEVQRGEREAEAERQRAERESEEQSWWEAALDAITDLFDALVSLINDIFDAVRSAVNAILNAVRDFALALIDLAADFLKGLISAFGEFLKGLVQGLLGEIFPELARALTEFIDAAVELANSAIDAVANTLKSAVNAIVEALRAGINALINAYQAAVNAALALARAALTGDWGAFIMQLIEAACRVAGLDPAQVFALIGRAQDTIQLIVDNPGGFLSNLVDAFTGGIQRFADHFLTHLQAGIIGWLTGTLGGAGISLPERFDLMGVISLVAQILGLTWENLRIRLVRIVGERGVQVIEFVASYIQTLIQGGWNALWERIQNDLGTLRDMVLEQIRSFLVERIIMAAITRLATMFNPVGALVNLLIAAYQFYTFIRDQLQRIMQIVTTIVDAVSNIARGVLEPAQTSVENFLAGLLPLAIDLLARLIGLGDVGERVRGILTSVQETIWSAIDRLINSVVGLFRGGAAGQPVAAGAGAGAGAAGQIGERLPINVPDHETHYLSIEVQGQNAVLMLHSTPRPVLDQLSHWQTMMNMVESARQSEVLGMIENTRRLVTEGDREADTLAVARWHSREATPQAVDRAREMQTVEQQLSNNERSIVTLLMQLYPIFEEDTRNVAQRFDQANSRPALAGVFQVEAWMAAFPTGGNPTSRRQVAVRDMRWGVQNHRANVHPSGGWKIQLSDNDLVALAVRVIAAEGRTAAELVGPSKPFFTSRDIVAFCVRVERLPNDQARYSSAVLERITGLMVQRGDASRHIGHADGFMFGTTPPERRIPASWDSDKYRRHFYLNGSQYSSQRTDIVGNAIADIRAAATKLDSSDPAVKEEGRTYFNRLIARNIIDESDVENTSSQDLSNSSNWDADHERPLALHWSQGGNNTDQDTRKAVAEMPNLRLMWGPKNSREGGRGGSFVTYNWVGPDFTSPFTPRGGQMVDRGVFFANWDTERSTWR